MARYRDEDLLLIAKGAAKINLKRHLKQIGPHGTENCEYCNQFGRDLGLLPEPVAYAE